MLVAEALAARKASLKRISEMEDRLAKSAVTYKDEEPEENVEALLVQYGLEGVAFQSLSERINRTNNATTIAFDGQSMTMMEAVCLRERLLLNARGLKRVAEAVDTSLGRGRYGMRRTKDDVKVQIHMASPKFRKASDSSAMQVERLNIAMQQANWTTQLLD